MPSEETNGFGTPQKIWEVTENMQVIERTRACDRSAINILMNGHRPWTKAEEEEHHIEINVNWGEGPRIVSDGNRQLNNALLHPGTLFTCTLEEGPADKREEWSLTFTKNIHMPLQRGRSGKQHDWLIRNRNASIVLHGPGPILWQKRNAWLGRFVPLEDLLIPTDTYCDLSNLNYFAVNLYLTPGELVSMTQGKNVDKGWNKTMVRQILDALKTQLYGTGVMEDWLDRPEAMAEVHKQNHGYYYSDAVPRVKLRAFYHQGMDGDDEGKWFRKIILRENIGTVDASTQDKFLYDSKDPFADELDHFLNVQYGDSNLVPPFKYHSVRGLGVALFAPVETNNRLRCQYVQAIFEHLAPLFEIRDPSDRDRLKQIVLQRFGFIPEGLKMIGRTERHQIDPGLVESGMAQMRDIMQDSSASFVQNQSALGTGKELREIEAQAIINKANMMVQGMLNTIYLGEGFYYEEVVRRFLQKSTNAQIKEFQEKCRRDGIPDRYMKPSCWRIQPERVLGGGDKTIAQAQAQWTIQQLPLLEPQAQQKAKRMAFSVMLDDPAKGRLLVPDAPAGASNGTQAAEVRFGTLMQGAELSVVEGIEHTDYIRALLKLAIVKLNVIASTDNVGTPEDVIGLMAVVNDAGKHLQIVAQDKNNGELVKVFGDIIGKITNELKGFAQRQQEQQQSEQGDPEAMAKVQATMLQAQTKARISEMQALMKMEQKQAQFDQKMAQQAQKHVLDQEIAMRTAQMDALIKGTEAVQNVAIKKREAAAVKTNGD